MGLGRDDVRSVPEACMPANCPATSPSLTIHVDLTITTLGSSRSTDVQRPVSEMSCLTSRRSCVTAHTH
eukprot:14014-Eustigmatos_ZCMA.PRE.1